MITFKITYIRNKMLQGHTKLGTTDFGISPEKENFLKVSFLYTVKMKSNRQTDERERKDK
jgi:hypothetical protein